MNTDALKAAVAAIVSQAAALAIAYGLVDNVTASRWIALTMGIINAVFLISHAMHAQAAAPPANPPPAAGWAPPEPGA